MNEKLTLIGWPYLHFQFLLSVMYNHISLYRFYFVASALLIPRKKDCSCCRLSRIFLNKRVFFANLFISQIDIKAS